MCLCVDFDVITQCCGVAVGCCINLKWFVCDTFQEEYTCIVLYTKITLIQESFSVRESAIQFFFCCCSVLGLFVCYSVFGFNYCLHSFWAFDVNGNILFDVFCTKNWMKMRLLMSHSPWATSTPTTDIATTAK